MTTVRMAAYQKASGTPRKRVMITAFTSRMSTPEMMLDPDIQRITPLMK